jgi:hypothetical protein
MGFVGLRSGSLGEIIGPVECEPGGAEEWAGGWEMPWPTEQHWPMGRSLVCSTAVLLVNYEMEKTSMS